MPPLTSLPVELVTKIVSYVSPRRGLATLRLTCKTLNAIATPLYFHTVPLYPDWEWDEKDEPFPNHIEYEALYFKSILDSANLKELVKKVEIFTCNPDCVSILPELSPDSKCSYEKRITILIGYIMAAALICTTALCPGLR